MHKRLLLLFVCFSAGLVGSLSAVPILDQVNNTSGGQAGFNGASHWQQGVTAGVTGQLVGIELFLQGTAPVTFGINLGAPWQTDADDYTVNAPSNGYGWNYFDLTAGNLQMNAGQQFTINLIHASVGFEGTSHEGYAGGALFIDGVEFIQTDFVYDAAFRTYVAPGAATVPEAPLSLVLLGMSTLLLAGLRHRGQGACAA